VKAVVLARGKGTRMRAAAGVEPRLTPEQRRAADAGVKAMIPFRRPFLDYVLSALADAGCTEVALVVGPEHETIREYYTRDSPPSRVRVVFAVQEQPRGTADAVLAAASFVGRKAFLVLNSDNYYPVDVLRRLVRLDGPGLPAFPRDALIRLGNIDADRVRSYAILRLAPDGALEDIIEKPDDATYHALDDEDVLVSMNVWRFDASIFSACRSIGPSPRGELELPNAVRYAARALGQRFRTFRVEAGVLDLSRRSDIAEVERRLAGLDPRP